MKKWMTLFALVAAMICPGASQPLKVLMIGNSFSISNTRHMPKMCKAMGYELELASLYIGGCPLKRHWDNVVALSTNATFKPYSYSLFRDGERVKDAPKTANIPEIVQGTKWDVITMQQASPYSWKKESYSPYFDNLYAKIKEWCPGAEIVIQETWSYTPWSPALKSWKIDQHQMYASLHRAYYEIASAKGLRIIPMGTAVQLWRERGGVKYTEKSFGGDVVGCYECNDDFVQIDGKWVPNPGEEIPGSTRRRGKCDLTHLNKRGDYFQSLVWTAKLFGADMTKCTYRPDFISADEAKKMQQIAMAAAKGDLPSPAFGGEAHPGQ